MSFQPTTEKNTINENDDFAAVLDLYWQEPPVVTTTAIVSIY